MVERLDSSIGRILDTIEEQPDAANTLAVFTYDHGGAEIATIGGASLQQGFATLWEGGLRIPLIIHWPAGIQPLATGGDVVASPAIMMDVTATVISLTAVSTPSGVDLDGSLWPQISGEATEDGEERTFHWRLDLPPSNAWATGKRRAVRRGRWKYLWDGGFGYLFDLDVDPAERTNVLYRNEAIARELAALSQSNW